MNLRRLLAAVCVAGASIAFVSGPVSTRASTAAAQASANRETSWPGERVAYPAGTKEAKRRKRQRARRHELYEQVVDAHEQLEACERDPEHPPCGAAFGVFVQFAREKMSRSVCMYAVAEHASPIVRAACEVVYVNSVPAR